MRCGLDPGTLTSRPLADDGKAILAVGTFHATGTVILDNWYTIENAHLSQLDPGPYAFEYQDSGEQVLHQVSFDVSFVAEGNDVPVSSFVLTLPYIPGTSRIVVKQNDVQLGEKKISPHPPEVTIQSPNGDSYMNLVPIQWSASDDDSDALSYVLQYSWDGGTSWETITQGVTATSYSWDVTRTPPGNQYMVRVIATDGFNTAQDQSDAVFTITAPSAPGAPTLNAPQDGNELCSTTPVFEWLPATGADTYRLQVDDGPDFASPELEVTTATPAYATVQALLPGEYYWRVQGANAYVEGDWSAGRR